MNDGRYGFIPNLHIKLSGDSKRAGSYVPFGMEQVRKLLRLGQFSVQNNLVLNDGTTVHSKIVGDQQFLHIESPWPCELYLESGIVHVGSVGPSNPAFNDDGKLYLNPALETIPELNGLLTLPLGTEATPTPVSGDTAESFKKKSETDEHGNVTVDQDSLSELQRKKITVATIPPSLFTGKTRLYVQALYGRRLKHFKKWSMNLAFQPPALRYESGDTIVDISTNTGIFTTEDYRYFLLTVEGGSNQSVAVRELVAESECVERARAWLVANKDKLTEQKKTALEAYILSGSYPSGEITFKLDAVITTNWQMGYGWHFNWSGTACDIVDVETINTGGSTYKHKSTHYRMEFVRDKGKVIPVSEPPLTPVQQERMRWAAIKQTTVETAEWKNYKWQHVIAFPDWSEQKLQIFGQQLGTRFGDNAPVYCFYNRDALKVVRYTCQGAASIVEYMCESDPPYYYGVFGWGVAPTGRPCGGGVVGTEPGRSELRQRTSTDLSVAIGVDGVSIGETDASYTYSLLAKSEKTRTYADSWYSSFSVGSGGFTVESGRALLDVVNQYGCVNAPGGFEGSTTLPGPDTASASSYISTTWTDTDATGSKSELTLTLIVVPFGDAEAAYLWGRKDTVVSESGTIKGNSPTGSQPLSITKGWGSGIEAVRHLFSDITMGGVTGSHSVYEADYAPLGAKFISGYGIQDFVPSSVVSAFFAGEPATHVAQQFWTVTSAGLRDTDGDGTDLTGGYPQGGHVFVGYA